MVNFDLPSKQYKVILRIMILWNMTGSYEDWYWNLMKLQRIMISTKDYGLWNITITKEQCVAPKKVYM